MAKLNMEKVRIFAPASEQKALFKVLQTISVLDVSATPETPPEGFYRESTNAEESRRAAADAQNALRVLDAVAPAKKGLLSMFSGRRQITMDEFLAASDKVSEIDSVCDKISELERRIAELKAEAVRLSTQKEQLSPWTELDIPLSFEGTDKTSAFVGSVTGTVNLEQLLSALAAELPETEPYAEIVGTASGQTLIFVTAEKKDGEAVAEALRKLGFSRPSVSCKIPPAEKIAELDKQIEEFNGKVEETKKQIASFAEKRQEIELVCDWHLSAAERNEVLGSADQTAHTICITGYVPAVDFEVLNKTLSEQFTVYIEHEAAEGDEAPVKLKNNGFAEPAESLTAMFSLPSAADVDPTPVTAFFYYFFFGLMLSDAGYGLLMWIATWAVNKFLHPEPNMRKNMKLFMYCGISTTLWGIFFGSFFGDITQTVEAITGLEKPFGDFYPFLNPLEGDAVAMLILSLALGLVQILAGLMVKFWITLKSDGFIDAFLDTGLWITTLLGFAVMATGFVTLPILQTVGIVIAAVSMLGIAVFGGRKKKGIMKIFGGVANLYDITGYVSDLLSFSRLMALGLTTAAISMVCNTLGGMMLEMGVIGIVLMVIILVAGHAVNFGLNALGAYVHTLRLQYVELFSKFYEGGGRAYTPFALKGKYVRIKEEK